MKTLEDAKRFAAQKVGEHPEEEARIMDLLKLAISEVEMGESEHHEVEMFMDDVERLVD